VRESGVFKGAGERRRSGMQRQVAIEIARTFNMQAPLHTAYRLGSATMPVVTSVFRSTVCFFCMVCAS